MRRLIGAIKRKIDFYLFKKNHPRLICFDQGIIYNNVIDRGRDNQIIIGKNSSLMNCSIQFYGKKCILEIKDNVRISNAVFWFEDEGGRISIGSRTTMENGCQFASVEGKNIIIGEDCMFSHDADVRTTDSHSILDTKGNRINPSEDVIIGNHVWVGIRVTILKGVKIADNCIVAACSLVSSKTESKRNSIIAGMPAVIVKNDINWDRSRL